MGKLTVFEIMVDNPGGMVKAGDTVRGQLLLELCADLEVNEVRVSFTGLSRIHWAEAHKTAPMTEIQTTVVDPVMAEEVYVSELKKLFPVSRSGTNHALRTRRTCWLTKGSYMFDFEFRVPDWAPSSFSGTHGNVRYTLKAVVERPWKVDVNMRSITVEGELDLNDVPAARDGVEVSDDMKFSTFLFSSGACRATMRLARKGFTLGEIIPVEFFIDNNSHHELYRVSLHLKMIISYKAEERRCTCELSLGRSLLGKVPAGRTFAGLDRSLRVPLTSQPSGLPGCRLIGIRYQVQLKIRPSILSLKRMKLTTTIIVGTKPLNVTPLYDNPPDYWSCCPPSYEDVVALSPRLTSTQPTTTQSPAIEIPTTTPSTETPSTQTASTETASSQTAPNETPSTQIPSAETPPTQTPSTQISTPQTPTTQTPPTQISTPQSPTTQTPSSQISTPQTPSTQTPSTLISAPQTPSTQTTSTQISTPQTPTTQTPSTQFLSTPKTPSNRASSRQPPSTQSHTTQTPSTQTVLSTQTSFTRTPPTRAVPSSTATTKTEPIFAAVSRQLSCPQKRSNDEPRLTVLRQTGTPGTGDEAEDGHHFIRPRANTVTCSGNPRTRGS